MIEFSDFQTRVMALPEDHDLFLGGGRGGGKSFVLMALAARHGVEYEAGARMVYLRQTHQGLRDAMDTFLEHYGGLGTMNMAQGLFRFDNGAVLEFNQLETAQQLQKYVGRSFTLLLADEAGEWAEPTVLDRLRANLRSAKGVPIRAVLAANPGGPGHAWLYARHVKARSPWRPYVESQTGATFVTCPSTLADNPHLDKGYRKQIEQATANDGELRRAWLGGDWHIARGAYFSDVVDENRVMLPDWSADDPSWSGVRRRFSTEDSWYIMTTRPHDWNTIHNERWKFGIAYDFGTSAPWVCFLYAETSDIPGPDGVIRPRGSILLLDEVDGRAGDSLSDGNGATIPDQADEIKAMCSRWDVTPSGVADDQIFNATGSEQGSIAEQFEAQGISFRRANKASRIPGWTTMRTMLANAGSERPGLYVARRCSGWWATAPSLARSTRDPQDVAKGPSDHWADACRYILTAERPLVNDMVRRPW